MSALSPRERELVAIGASIGSNCVPCVQFHIPAAKQAGLTDVQVQEAIKIADDVRKVPARNVYEEATRQMSMAVDREKGAPCCGSGKAKNPGQDKCC